MFTYMHNINMYPNVHVHVHVHAHVHVHDCMYHAYMCTCTRMHPWQGEPIMDLCRPDSGRMIIVQQISVVLKNSAEEVSYPDNINSMYCSLSGHKTPSTEFFNAAGNHCI